MIEISKKENCCGCNACGDICPRGAISFKCDEEGFLFPAIDYDKCIHCNLCSKICPVENREKLNCADFDVPICYAVNNNNLSVRFDSTSGGAFSAFADYFFEKQGFVGGAVYTDDWNVKQIVTNNKEDLTKLRSSKYLQSNAEGYYSTIKSLLENEKKVMAVGLPCQIAALKMFLGKEYDNLLTVDLICLYINSPLVFSKYLETLQKRYNSNVKYIKMKNKELGWRKLTFKIVFDNNETYYGPIDTDPFLNAGMGLKCISRLHCYQCAFKGFPRQGDISLGDYWNKDSVKLDDNTGTSIVLINSQKGKKYFDEITDRIIYEKTDIENVIKGNPALIKPISKTSIDRNTFYSRIMNEPFDEVVESMQNPHESKDLKHIVKNILKTIKKQIGFSRFCVKPNLQFIYYNFLHQGVHSSVFNGRLVYFCPNCSIRIAKNANLYLNEQLVIGENTYISKKSHTYIRLSKGSTMLVDKFINEGCRIKNNVVIELFDDACLTIGGSVEIGTGTTISCKDSITIGKTTIIENNVIIRDHNYGIMMSTDLFDSGTSIEIGSHVLVSDSAIVLQGANIGNGSVIKEHSVVDSRVGMNELYEKKNTLDKKNYIEWKK